MKEFFSILFSFDFEKIFYTPTNNSLLQFFRYAFVGGVATVADWAVFYILTKALDVYYLISGIAAFVLGLAVNFLLSKRFVFSAEEKKHSAGAEFAVYAVIGVIGLLMTEGIMYVLAEKLMLDVMLTKVIATAVVFVWNFAARKVALYR